MGRMRFRHGTKISTDVRFLGSTATGARTGGQNRLDPDPPSACDEVSAIATVAVSDEEPWLLTPGGRLDHLLPNPGSVRMLRDVPVPDTAPAVVDHDEHVERAEGERLDREQVGGPNAGRVVAEKRAPRLARRSPQRLPAVATYGAGGLPRSQGLAARRTMRTAPHRGFSVAMPDDQLSQLCVNPGSPGAGTTLPAPVGAPSRTMPAHHRVRLDHHERASPAGPTTCPQ